MKDPIKYIVKENMLEPSPLVDEPDALAEHLSASREAMIAEYLQGYDQVAESFADVISNLSNSLKFKGNAPLMKSNYINNVTPAFSELSKAIGVMHNQSTSIFDKITINFGLFDEDVKELNTKKSILLKKINVKNYMIKPIELHPIYSYGSSTEMLNSCYQFIYEGFIYYANRVFNEHRDDYKDCIKKYSDEYTKELAPYLTKHFGKVYTNNAIYKRFLFASVGDGSKIKYKDINFQKDYFRLQDRIDHINNFMNKTDAKDVYEHLGASMEDFNVRFGRMVKDIATQLHTKEQIAAINTLGKMALSEFKIVDQYYLQVTLAFLDMITLIRTDSLKICKGLLAYTGE